MPHWEYEKKLWKSGLSVCGIDEVGRGCFAGPIFVACVGFASGTVVPDDIMINDSKKVTQKRRENAKCWIESTANIIGVGTGSVDEINQKGIVAGFQLASTRALKNAEKNSGLSVDHLLIDAFNLPQYPITRQTALIKGDSLSLSIAAASILAKVERDHYMQELSLQTEFQKYGWDANKGYGTKEHRNAIVQYGITKHHRIQFVNTFLQRKNN